MNNIKYARAYTEVLELLSYLPKEEYEKIPKSEIEYFEKNKDREYTFMLDDAINLEEQDISIEANSIIVSLFRDYFATEKQKVKLEQILKSNSKENEQKKMETYNPGNVFKNRAETINDTYIEEVKQESKIEREAEAEIKVENSITKYKESIFKRLVNWFKSLINR